MTCGTFAPLWWTRSLSLTPTQWIICVTYGCSPEELREPISEGYSHVGAPGSFSRCSGDGLRLKDLPLEFYPLVVEVTSMTLNGEKLDAFK